MALGAVLGTVVGVLVGRVYWLRCSQITKWIGYMLQSWRWVAFSAFSSTAQDFPPQTRMTTSQMLSRPVVSLLPNLLLQRSTLLSAELTR